MLKGHTAAITGGSAGIGRGIALAFHRQGANVAINYFPDLTQEGYVESLRKEIPNLVAIAGDISVPETSQHLIEQTVAAFGEVTIFVSNAGICPFHEFTTMPADIYRRTVQVNMDGAFFATQAAAAQMVRQGKGGSIIGISSISALVGGEFQTHYTPTKAAVLSLMQSTAIALGKHGIRCNALLPGTIETDINKDDLADATKRQAMVSRIPLGRLGVPNDLGGPAVFLASDLSRYVTGAQILVDGGLFVNLQ